MPYVLLVKLAIIVYITMHLLYYHNETELVFMSNFYMFIS